jgi:hypothetical protein
LTFASALSRPLCYCCLQPDDLASIRSILPKPEELQAVRDAKQAAEQKIAAATGSSPRTPAAAAASSAAMPATPSTLSPRLGPVEAAFDALGGVELLQAKMRAMEFRCGRVRQASVPFVWLPGFREVDLQDSGASAQPVWWPMRVLLGSASTSTLFCCASLAWPLRNCRYDVDAVASVVSDYTADIARSLVALRSGSLQQLLAFVRDVANIMNRAGPKGPLAGFKLESLARLQVRFGPAQALPACSSLLLSIVLCATEDPVASQQVVAGLSLLEIHQLCAMNVLIIVLSLSCFGLCMSLSLTTGSACCFCCRSPPGCRVPRI